MAENLFYCHWQLFLERGHYFAASLLYQLFAFFHHVGRHNVVQVFGRNFDLDTLNAVAANYSDSVFGLLVFGELVFNRVFETD